MLRFELVDDVDPSFAADDLVIGTDFLDAGTHFHADHLLSRGDSLLTELLTFAIGDSALRKIVRGQLDRHAVAWYDPDEVLPHLPCDMSYNFMAVLEFYAKLSPREGLNNRPS
jgi:hypothetical protein